MSSPRFKVYSPAGEYVAACKIASDAAAIVAAYGEGAQIRDGHRRILWTEGESSVVSAANSYDEVGDVVLDRLARGSK